MSHLRDQSHTSEGYWEVAQQRQPPDDYKRAKHGGSFYLEESQGLPWVHSPGLGTLCLFPLRIQL